MVLIIRKINMSNPLKVVFTGAEEFEVQDDYVFTVKNDTRQQYCQQKMITYIYEVLLPGMRILGNYTSYIYINIFS